MEGGTATIKQDLALQPTAKLIVDAGATCTLASGVRLYVYDRDHSNLGKWNQYGSMFSMVITGFENIQNLRANMVAVSDTNTRYVSSFSVSITK